MLWSSLSLVTTAVSPLGSAFPTSFLARECVAAAPPLQVTLGLMWTCRRQVGANCDKQLVLGSVCILLRISKGRGSFRKAVASCGLAITLAAGLTSVPKY